MPITGAVHQSGGTTVYGGAVVDDAPVLKGDATLDDGVDLAVGTSTGTKIGTSATQKIGFFGVTPVVQPSALTQTYTTADATLAALTAVAPAAMTAADLTDNTAGTADATLEALTSGSVYASDVAAIRNNFADLAAMVDKLTVDLTASRAELVKLVADHADLAQFTNSLVDKMQALGLVA